MPCPVRARLPVNIIKMLFQWFIIGEVTSIRRRMDSFAEDFLQYFLQFRFQPSIDLLVVLASFLVLGVCVYVAFQVVTPANATAYFILWIPVSYFAAGIAVPTAYNSLVKKRPLSEMGIGKRHWKKSLVLGLILPCLTSWVMIARGMIPPLMEFLPTLWSAIMSSLFFVIFFQCWVQTRFERAFGAIPAIIMTAALFSLHHISYGGYCVTYAWMGVLQGTMPALLFSTTRNILVAWPFLLSAGLYGSFGGGYWTPFEYTYGFAGVVALTLSFIAIVHWRQKKRGTPK